MICFLVVWSGSCVADLLPRCLLKDGTLRWFHFILLLALLAVTIGITEVKNPRRLGWLLWFAPIIMAVDLATQFSRK
jgi:hypothetical protein